MSQICGQNREWEERAGCGSRECLWFAPVAACVSVTSKAVLCCAGDVLFRTVHSNAVGHCCPTCLCDGVNKKLESPAGLGGLRQRVATWEGSKRDRGDVTENAGLTISKTDGWGIKTEGTRLCGTYLPGQPGYICRWAIILQWKSGRSQVCSAHAQTTPPSRLVSQDAETGRVAPLAAGKGEVASHPNATLLPSSTSWDLSSS